MRGYPLSGYGYFPVSPSGPNAHPLKWVDDQATDLVDFQRKGNLVPEFHQSDWAHLKDNMDIGPKDVMCESPITTLLQDDRR